MGTQKTYAIYFFLIFLILLLSGPLTDLGYENWEDKSETTISECLDATQIWYNDRNGQQIYEDLEFVAKFSGGVCVYDHQCSTASICKSK